VLPALTLALPAAAMIARLTRSAMLEALGEESGDPPGLSDGFIQSMRSKTRAASSSRPRRQRQSP